MESLAPGDPGSTGYSSHTEHCPKTYPNLRIRSLEPSLLEPYANVQFLSGYIPDMCSEAGGPVYTEAEVLVTN